MSTSAPGMIKNHAAFIWSVADLLRGDYKQSEYGKVILPLTVIRRLDCVLEPTKNKVLAVHKQYGDRDAILRAAAGDLAFYNTSPLTLQRVLADPTMIADQLRAYLSGFSEAARDVIEKFEFDAQITRLARANLLYLVMSKFCDPRVDLHPDKVSNLEMGYLYEELIRRFSELSNETAGEHFTPREVIRLMVDLLLTDEPELHKPGIVKTLLDPACGTGGMLSISEQRLRELNPDAVLKTYGQELNAETYAVCRSDMMIKGQDADNIAFGNSFSEDAFDGESYDYLLASPFRRRVEKGRRRGQGRALQGWLWWPVRRRVAAHQRWQFPIPAAHDLEDEAAGAGRHPACDRVQWLAAVHRRGRLR